MQRHSQSELYLLFYKLFIPFVCTFFGCITVYKQGLKCDICADELFCFADWQQKTVNKF